MKVSAAVALAVLLAAVVLSVRLIGDVSFTEKVPVSVPTGGTLAAQQSEQRVTLEARRHPHHSQATGPVREAVATVRRGDRHGHEVTRPRAVGRHSGGSLAAARRVDNGGHAAPAVRDEQGGRTAPEPQDGPVSRPRHGGSSAPEDNSGPGNADERPAPGNTSGSGTSGSGSSDSGSSGTGSSGTGSSGATASSTASRSSSGSGSSGDSSGKGSSGSGDSSGSGSSGDSSGSGSSGDSSGSGGGEEGPD